MYEALEPQGVYLSQSNLEKLCRSNEGKKDPVNAAVNYYLSDPVLFSDNSDEPASAGMAFAGSEGQGCMVEFHFSSNTSLVRMLRLFFFAREIFNLLLISLV